MAARGARHHRTRLTEDDVIAIRQRRADGETERSIGSTYGLSPSTVHAILTGKTWTHVGTPELTKPCPPRRAKKPLPRGGKIGVLETVWSGTMKLGLMGSFGGGSTLSPENLRRAGH